MHKSQGFGSLKRRGSEKELFILTQGEKYNDDLMDGIVISAGNTGALLVVSKLNLKKSSLKEGPLTGAP